MIIYQMLMMLWEVILENGLLVAILLTLLIVPWLYWLIKNRQKKFNPAPGACRPPGARRRIAAGRRPSTGSRGRARS